MHSEPTEKADILNGQFQKAFSEKNSISNEEFQKQCKMTGKFNTIKNINITENGVNKLLKDLNPNKAAGPDNITPRVLKELATHIAPIVTIIFRCSYQNNQQYDCLLTIRVITKLPNSEQSYKGKVKTHKYINRQNQSTTGKL